MPDNDTPIRKPILKFTGRAYVSDRPWQIAGWLGSRAETRYTQRLG
ncbi:hypothetical protein [Pectobacterium wasabiae]|nr:hypothetical protein [Pectobacterium wasabiae]